MADQEVNVEKSGEFKSLGGVGKTISTVGWVVITIGGLLLISAVSFSLSGSPICHILVGIFVKLF